MSYQDWPEDTLPIVEMFLDAKNPRISTPLSNERELIAEYMVKYKVYGLAKNIAENGYFPNERLIVIEEDGKNIVVEGNRRLTALKSLLNPEVVPDNMKNKFKALNSGIVKVVEEVPVVFAPSRDDANKIIMYRHTRNPIYQWNPINQARFIYDMAEKYSVDQISKDYKIPYSAILSFIKSYKTYIIAKELDIPKIIKDKVQDEENFSLTNLNRVMAIPKVRKFLGFDFDEEGKIIGSVDVEEFKKGYKKIISDISEKKITSRSEELKPENIDKYLKSFGDVSPDKSKTGTFSDNDVIKHSKKRKKVKSVPDKSTSTASKRRAKNKPLIPKFISYNLQNTSLNNVFNELQSIQVGKTPHATAVLFRSFLQMSIAQYLEEEGLLNEVTKDNDKFITLNDLLIFIINKKSPITDKNVIAGINLSKSKREEVFSLDTMNNIVHNKQICVCEEDLRYIWANFESLMKIILKGE